MIIGLFFSLRNVFVKLPSSQNASISFTNLKPGFFYSFYNYNFDPLNYF